MTIRHFDIHREGFSVISLLKCKCYMKIDRSALFFRLVKFLKWVPLNLIQLYILYLNTKLKLKYETAVISDKGVTCSSTWYKRKLVPDLVSTLITTAFVAIYVAVPSRRAQDY